MDSLRLLYIRVADISSRPLKTEYLARTLYAMLRLMADKDPGFYSGAVDVEAQGKLIFNLKWGPLRPHAIGSDASRGNVSTAVSSTDRLSNNGRVQGLLDERLAADDGGVINEGSRIDLEIFYSYNGASVLPNDLAFAIFDGVAKVAQFESIEPRDYVTAVG